VTVTRGVALALTIALAALFGDVPRAANSTMIVPEARLTGISARTSANTATVVIETTAPVAYVATRPDPLTLLVDFRNVTMAAAPSAPAVKSPIDRVSVEPVDALGAPVSRIRIALSEPAVHHVRSERNTVVVEFERGAQKPAALATPIVVRTANPLAPAAKIETPAIDPIAALGLATPPQTGRQVVAARAAAAQVVPRPAIPAPTPVNPQGQTTTTQTTADLPGMPRQTGQRQYSGNPISLDFQQADLRAVLRVFSEISGLNIVIDPTVKGTVDVALRDVPWDQALDIILRANKLGYIVDGTIVRIAPLATLADEESQRRKLADEQALAGELRVLTRTLSYAKAEDMQQLLTKSALSQRGTVQVDPRTNMLIITDLADRLTTAEDLISQLDRAQPQVEIEARIVQADKNYARRLGIQWGFNGIVDPTLGNTTGLAFPNSGTVAGRAGPTQGPNNVGTAVNLGAPAPNSGAGISLGSINGAFNLDVAITAAESSGNLRVLSTPRVSAQNNMEAEITQGVQIPIQTVSNNTVTVSFRDAALTLKVVPQITAAGTVIMKIALENAQPDFSRSINGIPPINTQRANTQVRVNDGQTTVIGGIFVSQDQANTDKTPGLGSVPLIKWLFKREDIRNQSTELLIFITPRITKG
jgi:type IV pilus secretin PilQ/predicted competence protein